MMEGWCLEFVNVARPFEVEIEPSDFVMWGVFLKDGHPITYESQKFNKGRYAASKKEMLVVVHYLRTWRKYLIGAKFIV